MAFSPISLISSATTPTASARLQTRLDGATSAPSRKHPRHVIRTKPANQTEVIRSLEGWAREHMLPLLRPVEESWQPQDFLPDSSKPSDEFMEQVRALRERTAGLSDDYFVVLVGDMITEEAVPTYHSMLTNTHGFQPESGSDPSPWATWTRCWSAEENRHGDLLRSYLYLSGRVDMTMVDRTIQYLIGSGMDTGLERSPYMLLVYTSFQERATAVSHGNTARLAKQQGDVALAHICGTITADEKRHERAYSAAVGKILEVDPNGGMLAVADMMRKSIVMPSHLMQDGRDPRLFQHYSAVAQRLGVYTTADYVDILEHMVGLWRLADVEGLTAEGREAQEYVCGLPQRFRRLQERTEERAKKVKPCGAQFSWIFNKQVSL